MNAATKQALMDALYLSDTEKYTVPLHLYVVKKKLLAHSDYKGSVHHLIPNAFQTE